MEKENTKLESRQDVLSLWETKWATIHEEKVDNIFCAENIWMIAYLHIRDMQHVLSIYDLIYAPESNFFEVMFWGLEEQHNPDIPERKYIKQQCATALDQLTYILDNISDTTS